MIEHVDHVLVLRLFQAYTDLLGRSPDLFGLFKSLTLDEAWARVQTYPAVSEHMDEDERSDPAKFRSKKIVAYDLGRVRYFAEQLNETDIELDPITIDNNTGHQCIYPEPVVLDGHHRLAAYKLARRRTIPAHYGGRLDVLDYLTGKRRKLPRE